MFPSHSNCEATTETVLGVERGPTVIKKDWKRSKSELIREFFISYQYIQI